MKNYYAVAAKTALGRIYSICVYTTSGVNLEHDEDYVKSKLIEMMVLNEDNEIISIKKISKEEAYTKYDAYNRVSIW